MALFADDNILVFDEYFGNVTFTTDNICILCVNLNSIKLDDANFYKGDPKTIIHVRFLGWRNKLRQLKAFKKEIIKKCNACSVAPNSMVRLEYVRRWKKEIEPFFIDEKKYKFAQFLNKEFFVNYKVLLEL